MAGQCLGPSGGGGGQTRLGRGCPWPELAAEGGGGGEEGGGGRGRGEEEKEQ
jgi:hypothetical protein